MDQSRTCQLEYHTQPYTYICVSLKCKEKIRLLCQKCLIHNPHDHDDGPKQNYIIELNQSEELERILKQRFNQIQLQAKDMLNKYALLVSEAINFLKQHIEQAQKKYEDLFKNSLSLLKKIINEKPFNILNILKMDNIEIERLLNITPDKVNFNFIDEMMQVIQQGIQMVKEKQSQQSQQSQIKQQDVYQRKQDLQNTQLNNVFASEKNTQRKLILPNEISPSLQKNHLNDQLNILIDSQFSCQVFHQSKKDFYHAEISPNEQYLVYGGKDKRLYIYDLNRKTLSDKNLDYFISVCRFTSDSKILFVGCNLGFVYIFSTENNFQQLVVKEYFFKDWVVNIYSISNQEFILSSENSYVVRAQVQNIESQKMFCKDQGQIFCLEYNKDLDIIIVAGDGKFIIALDGKSGESLINQPQAHESKISQMQLVNNNKELITLDSDGKLKWWNINYKQKIFQEIRNYYDTQNRIHGFYSILDQQFLIVIGEKSVNIIDKENQGIIKQIEYSGYAIFKFRQIHQLNSLKYILVPCERHLILLSR